MFAIFHACLLQTDMHALGIQPLTICHAKQGLNDVFSDLRSTRIAGDAKLVSTGGDIYIEAAFDLAYVLIKLSAEIGKTVVIGGFQNQVLGYCYGVQGLKFGPLPRNSVGVESTAKQRALEVKKLTYFLCNSAIIVQAPTQGVRQRFGNQNVDELADPGRLPVKIDPAHVLGASGKLPGILFGGFFDQY